MLVLSRKSQQQICIGDSIRITVLKIRGRTVRLGIEAPDGVRIVRAELQPLSDEARAGQDAPATRSEVAAEPSHHVTGGHKEGAEDDAQGGGPLALRVRRRCQSLWVTARWIAAQEPTATSPVALPN